MGAEPFGHLLARGLGVGSDVEDRVFLADDEHIVFAARLLGFRMLRAVLAVADEPDVLRDVGAASGGSRSWTRAGRWFGSFARARPTIVR